MASLWISPLTLPDVPVHPAPAAPSGRSGAPTGARRPAPVARRAVRARRRCAGETAARARLRAVETVPSPTAAVLARRRLAAVAVLTGMAFAGWQAVSAVAAVVVDSPATQLGSAPTGPVVVREARAGDTLWALAERFGPDGDVRRSIDQLARLNGGSAVVAGQPVRLPASWFAGGAS